MLKSMLRAIKLIFRAARPPSRSPTKAPQPPGAPYSGEALWLRFRTRGSSDDQDDHVTIRRIEGKEQNGATVLTRIVGWSDAEERERSYPISSITALMPDEGDIEGRAAIMYWLRCKAGVATDAEHLAAGLAASDAEAAESGDDMLAQRLRLAAWIRYEDRDKASTERQITITAISGWRDDSGAPEISGMYAYCHLRRAARFFSTPGIVRIGDTQAELQGDQAVEPEAWLLQRGGSTDRAKPKRAAARRQAPPHG